MLVDALAAVAVVAHKLDMAARNMHRAARAQALPAAVRPPHGHIVEREGLARHIGGQRPGFQFAGVEAEPLHQLKQRFARLCVDRAAVDDEFHRAYPPLFEADFCGRLAGRSIPSDYGIKKPARIQDAPANVPVFVKLRQEKNRWALFLFGALLHG